MNKLIVSTKLYKKIKEETFPLICFVFFVLVCLFIVIIISTSILTFSNNNNNNNNNKAAVPFFPIAVVLARQN